MPFKIRFQDEKNEYTKEFNLKPLEVIKTLASKNRITKLKLKGIDKPSEFEIVNSITKKEYLIKYLYKLFKDFSITRYEDSIETLKINNINYSLTDKELVVFSGNYTITNDLIFPKNKKIIFSPGINFVVQKDKSILVRSNLEIKGTANKPVTISNKVNGEPFGVLAVIGRDKFIDVN